MRQQYSPWVPYSDAELLRRFAAGESAKAISAALERTIGAVHQRRYQLGYRRGHTRRPWAADEIAELRRLATQSMTAAEAARTLGRTSAGVAGQAKRHKIKLRARSRVFWTSDQDLTIIELARLGWPAGPISRVLNRTHTAVKTRAAWLRAPLRAHKPSRDIAFCVPLKVWRALAVEANRYGVSVPAICKIICSTAALDDFVSAILAVNPGIEQPACNGA